ncbi:MAG: AAA family ATPase [Ilumatobacter sp.]|nr:AAA family ATPase [Ilumatobacter sp.]
MADVFEERADEFVAAMNSTLRELAGADHVVECTIEAANLVSACIDADGRHTDRELDSWTSALGRKLTPPMILTAKRLRDDDTLGGSKAWLTTPSTMFDLLVKADAKDGGRRANTYYTHALELAHATAALDLVPSADEIAAIDRYRTMLLTTMDDHGVPRPGRPAAAAASTAGAAAPPTEVELPPERSIEDLLAELDALVGLDHVKTEVRRLTSLLRIQELRAARDLPTMETSKHLVFTGNPGTGKTTVARLLSQIFRTLDVVSKGHLVETDRSALVAGYVGQTATTTRKVLESALGGTLLIDEAYALARGGENDFGLEAVDTIVKFMEDHRDDLSVVAAGYPAEMVELIDSNPGLKSRFTRTIEFPDYDTVELIAIFRLISERKEYHLDGGAAAKLADVIEAEPRGRGFGNARFVRNVFEGAVGLHALRLADVADPTDEQLTTLTAADIEPA